MSRRPSHPVRLLASALAAGALLTTAACSDGGGSESAADTAAEQAAVAERNAAEQTPSGSPTGSPTGSPSASPGTLTESGAKAALLTEADLEGDWNQVGDADKWRDRLLVGKVDVSDFLTAKADASDCQQLLDGLYRSGWPPCRRSATSSPRPTPATSARSRSPRPRCPTWATPARACT
ncbi:hypothetical protein EV562_101769 [Streptomyces sp. BK208]|nr:hypothetical protein EV562_101769 [Streptomyces sp. BK208]